ncbi:MAG: undecaprenyl-phosphate galactose phosphotransferase WbaP [Treponema sp.]|jgi:Undecaprenyl-phosphate galactose phosphotransferase WbaP|nr:undecaprenyl-phosphate galactose phosphotransferase WbaP [Treponema sp.]
MTVNEFDIWYRSRYRRTSSALTTTVTIISDLFSVMLTFGIGFFIVNLYDMSAINFRSFVMYWPYVPIFIVIFLIFSLYPGCALAPAEEFRKLSIGSYIAYGGIIFSRYIEDGEFDAISVAFLISAVVSVYVLSFCRARARSFLGVTKLGGIPAVIYGGGNMGHSLIDKLLDNSFLGYVPAVILDDDPEVREYRGVPVIHDTACGPKLVTKFNIKMAIVAMPKVTDQELSRLITESVSAFRYNVIIPSFFQIGNIWMSIRDFSGILGLATTQRLKLGWNRALKRCMDLFVVLVGGLIILPFLLIIALLVKFSSRGPAIYASKRCLPYGKVFYQYKFRTMCFDAEGQLRKILDTNPAIQKEWEKNRKLKNDPRVTKIGAFLRKTSLDEFPQLLNILRGEMSLVGPRAPLDEGEMQKFGTDFNRIFSVRPGLTGFWQISGRSDTNYEERVAFDTYYLQSWSLWLDIWVLYKTVGVVLRGRGAY